MIVIFAGPTLRKDEVNTDGDFLFAPPVKHGDILQILRSQPKAIGIVDGYFEGAAAVWHKEILYALDQGVPVFGSSSMGALRAAELHAFGMQGIGQVFEWYRDGVICDDDEVAVLHGPQEVGYVVASVPMVNIRATLALAHEHEVISETQRLTIEDEAKRIFYKKRSWNRVLDSSRALFDKPQLKQQLTIWLKNNAVDQKKRDAFQLLSAMQNLCETIPERSKRFEHFEWTQVWDEAFDRITQASLSEKRLSENDHNVLRHLSLQPDEFERIQNKALLRYATGQHTVYSNEVADVKRELDRFRKNTSLRSRAQLIDYMTRADLTEPKLKLLLEGVNRVEQLKRARSTLYTEMIDELKLAGQYPGLVEICTKKVKLAKRYPEQLKLSSLQKSLMLQKYAEQHLRHSSRQELNDHLENTAFDNIEDFCSAIALDCLYREKSG